MRRLRESTATSLVLAALVREDDFLTAPQLVALTGKTGNQVSAALHSLLGYKAVDFVEAGKALWWFATPATDTRVRRVEERHPETRPRKPRKKRGLRET